MGAAAETATGSRRSRRPALAVGLLSLVLSTGLIAANHPYAPKGDSADYAYVASRLAHGHGFTRDPNDYGFTREPNDRPTAFRGPLYPTVLAAVFVVTGDSTTAAQLATAAIGALAVVLLFLLVQHLWGRRPALFAGLLAAVFPPLLAANIGFFTEPLFLALELAAMLALLAFRRSPEGLRLPLLIGALCGLASLTRSNGFLLLLILALGVWFSIPERAQAWKATGLTVLAAAVVVAPWTIRNAVVFDELIPTTTQSGYSLISVLNDKSRAANGDYRVVSPRDVGVEATQNGHLLSEAQYNNKLMAAAKDYARDHPGYVVKAAVLNTLRTLELWSGKSTGFVSYGANGIKSSRLWDLLAPSSYALYLLAIAGFGVMLRHRRLPRPPPFFYAVPIVLLLSSALAAGALRYSAPFDPLLLAFAGLAVATLVDRYRPATPSRYSDPPGPSAESPSGSSPAPPSPAR